MHLCLIPVLLSASATYEFLQEEMVEGCTRLLCYDMDVPNVVRSLDPPRSRLNVARSLDRAQRGPLLGPVSAYAASQSGRASDPCRKHDPPYSLIGPLSRACTRVLADHQRAGW